MWRKENKVLGDGSFGFLWLSVFFFIGFRRFFYELWRSQLESKAPQCSFAHRSSTCKTSFAEWDLPETFRKVRTVNWRATSAWNIWAAEKLERLARPILRHHLAQEFVCLWGAKWLSVPSIFWHPILDLPCTPSHWFHGAQVIQKGGQEAVPMVWDINQRLL